MSNDTTPVEPENVIKQCFISDEELDKAIDEAPDLQEAVYKIPLVRERLKKLAKEIVAEFGLTSREVEDAIKQRAVKPNSWTRSSHGYYTEHSANLTKTALDKLCEVKTPQIYKIRGMKLNSLYIKWNLGLRFLLDHMDKEGKYRELIKTVDVIRNPEDAAGGAGIIIKFRESTVVDASKCVMDLANSRAWRNKVEDCLENLEEGQRARFKDILITDVDKQWIENLFYGMENLFKINMGETWLTITRIKPDETLSAEHTNVGSENASNVLGQTNMGSSVQPTV